MSRVVTVFAVWFGLLESQTATVQQMAPELMRWTHVVAPEVEIVSLSHRSSSGSIGKGPVAEPQRLAQGNGEQRITSPALGCANRVEWTAGHSMSPMPKGLPQQLSVDADGAGFCREWAVRSLKGLREPSGYIGRPSGNGLSRPLDLVLAIISEAKRPNDQWGPEVELALWGAMESRFPVESGLTRRLFCNAIGCLVYLEGSVAPAAADVIHATLSSDPLRSLLRSDPVVGHLIGVGATGTRSSEDVTWILVMLSRVH